MLSNVDVGVLPSNISFAFFIYTSINSAISPCFVNSLPNIFSGFESNLFNLSIVKKFHLVQIIY